MRMVAPHKPAANSHKASSLSEVISRWRSISDEQTIARLEKLLQQPGACGIDGALKPALSQSTLAEYIATMRLLQTRLAEEWTGQPRHSLPSYIECLLRPNGPKFIAQFLTDPAEGRRVSICMTSVVQRCFPALDLADRERSVKAWRALLSDFRRDYMKSRDQNGGFGGYVDEAQLLSAQEIKTAVDKLQVGSGERLMLRLLELLVPSFPERCRVNSPLLHLGHIKILTANSAPNLDAWARDVAADETRESGLLLLGAQPKLFLLFADQKNGPVAAQFDVSGLLAAELHAYLSKMPAGLDVLFPQVRGKEHKGKAYEGAVGRDSFNARVNMVLSKVFGDAAVTQTIFRLSIVHAQQQQHAKGIAALQGRFVGGDAGA